MLAKEVEFVLRYLLDWFGRPSRWRRRTAPPTILNLPITDNCNSRCVMCDVWKNKSVDELSPQQLESILRDRLFTEVRHVGISGGEPSLRRDLAAIVEATISALPRLSSISITTHAFHTQRWEQLLPEILARCRKGKVSLTLNISLDGIGAVHDSVRRIPGGYARLMDTYALARRLGAGVRFQSTISRENIYDIGRILDEIDSLHERLDFRLATEIRRLENQESMKRVALRAKERSFFADFLVSKLLLSATSSPARRLFYRSLAWMLIHGGSRRAPCHYQREGILIDAHGKLFQCSITQQSMGSALDTSPTDLYYGKKTEEARQSLFQNTCRGCVHDQSGAWAPHELTWEVLMQSRLGQIAGKVSSTVSALALALSLSPLSWIVWLHQRGRTMPSIKSRVALCIGMYGGEHVGDAAILGGVIERVVLKYGVARAYVASFRPDRTQRWVDSLHLAIPLRVIPSSSARDYLNSVDMVVLAGGPVMDLVHILNWQLGLALAAIRTHRPFVIEGVGIGPFKTRIGRTLGLALLRLGHSVSVRSARSGAEARLASVDAVVGRDPAFDYLETCRESWAHRPRLDGLPALASVAEFRIGVNLRPFWRKYIQGAGNAEVLEKTFINEFGNALLKFHQQVSGSVEFVFFPLNADQYGFSDLQMAYRLAKRLPKPFPLTVWEAEPDPDELMAFLSCMHAVIAMRLHASIFSLVARVPTIGIDYSIGRVGKVGELFEDLNMSDFLCDVGTFSSSWLVGRLSDVLAQEGGGRIPRL